VQAFYTSELHRAVHGSLRQHGLLVSEIMDRIAKDDRVLIISLPVGVRSISVSVSVWSRSQKRLVRTSRNFLCMLFCGRGSIIS